MKNNKTYILGISAFYNDASAALICDGEIMAAAEEERFTRKKNDRSFPVESIKFCMKEAGISIDEVDVVACHGRPSLDVEEYVSRMLGFTRRIVFIEHHISHAASAFYPSPFERAAILVVDNMNNGPTVSFGRGRGHEMEVYEKALPPNSLALLYSAFTYYCGFKPNSDEYKLMGLAPYGRPVYVDLIFDKLLKIKKDGFFQIDSKYINFYADNVITNDDFDDLFGGLLRKPGDKIRTEHMDIARSIQEVTEKVMMHLVERLYEGEKEKNLCMSGELALNCVCNGKILNEGPFEKIWVQPASSDSGGAIGAALEVWHKTLGKKRKVIGNRDSQKGSLLGPSFSEEDIEKYLLRNNIEYDKMNEVQLVSTVADLLADQKVIGWFQGRMEFGPRALGSRSILGDPRSTKMQSILNDRVKFREPFRPFAPSVLLEKAEEYYELSQESPYMSFAVSLKADKKHNVEISRKLRGLEKLKIKRSAVQAVTHVDYSSRVQTVSREDNPLFHDLIKHFYELHDCSMVVNTSFNVKGEPIVCTPDDAYKCFMRTNIDHLVIGPFLIYKQKQALPEELETEICARS